MATASKRLVKKLKISHSSEGYGFDDEDLGKGN
jgi:hypothetical protein